MSRPPIPERLLLEQLGRFAGWRYRTQAVAHFPTKVPRVGVRVSPPTETDCCSFLTGWVIPVAHEVEPLEGWGYDRFRQLQLMVREPWAPIDALVALGLGTKWDGTGAPRPYSWCQGWNYPDELREGHSFMIADVGVLAPDPLETEVLMVEANYRNALDIDGNRRTGVGFRRIAMVDGPGLPPDWRHHPRVVRLGEIFGWWKHVQAVELDVDYIDAVKDQVDAGDPNPERFHEIGGSIRA